MDKRGRVYIIHFLDYADLMFTYLLEAYSKKTRGRIMSGSLPEKDWKYLRSIEPELLSELCRKINQRAAHLLSSEFESEHKKYLAFYKHITDSDKIVADCFNDWLRSNLWFIVPLLRRHNVLKDEHIANLSDAARELPDRFDRL